MVVLCPSAGSLLGLPILVTRLTKRYSIVLPSLTHSLLRRSWYNSKSISTTENSKKDTPLSVLFTILGAEVGFEPHDLRVMSPTSYQAALLRDMWCRWPDLNRYGNFFPTDFKSVASADSATSAYLPCKYNTHFFNCQAFFIKKFRHQKCWLYSYTNTLYAHLFRFIPKKG